MAVTASVAAAIWSLLNKDGERKLLFMCVLCGELVLNVHWTDQPIHDREFSKTVVVGELQRDRMRDRLRRVYYTNRILSFHGLTLRDWNGSKYLLSDRKGSQVVVNDLGDMWPAAQKMTNNRLDPLDPELLEFLPKSGRNKYARTENHRHAQ
jgi:hypothetical protein